MLCLVTDRLRCEGRALEEVVAAAVDGGVGMVQLREKDLPAAKLYALARRLRGITRGRALLYVNDRVDVALAAGADGVQLGEGGLPLKAARRVAGTCLLIGMSVHSVDGGVRAELEGADLLVAGTVFRTGSHPGRVPQGVGILEKLRERVRIPFLAIGGVTAENVGPVIRAGAAGAAVITAITQSDNPERASQELVKLMEEALPCAP